MKRETIYGFQYLVAETGDFDTIDDGETFFVMEDECGDQYYAYGHIDQESVEAEVTRYLDHMIPSGDFEVNGWTMHRWAKFTDLDGELFTFNGVTEADPGAFPVTVVKL